MKHARRALVLAALALASLSSVKTRGEPHKTATAAPINATDTAFLVEIAQARRLPPGLDESSPELSKIVALIRAGKTKAALPLVATYAKANAGRLEASKHAIVASWIVRRAVLVPRKDVYVAVDKLRFVKEGKLALANIEAGLSGKAPTDVVPAFALKAYAPGGDAVTIQGKKKVSSIRSDLSGAIKVLDQKNEEVKTSLKMGTQAYKAWMAALAAVASAKADVQKELSRYR